MASPQALPTSPTRRLTPVETASPDCFEVLAAHDNVELASLSVPMFVDADSPTAASYRVLLHRLRRLEREPEVIVVTSAKPGEGKTTLSLNLAAALCENADRPVLLVEANRQRPALADGFGICLPECFEIQLKRATTVRSMRWATVGLCNRRLHMLAVEPSGETGQPVPARAYRRLLEAARRCYGHVILDCPSVASAGDVSLLEDLADGTLLAARGGTTRGREVRRALAALAPRRFLGVVLIGGEA
jgi:Mrp family chromosome partitioning ATPase